MKITNLSLTHRTSVFVLLFIVITGGLIAYNNLPVESFPQIKQPVVIVSAPYVGVAPSDMETLIAKPLEDRITEMTKVKKMTSSSTEGFTSIVVEFEPDIDIDEAVRKTREKVDLAKPDLPGDLDEPLVQEINFENIPIMLVSIVGNQSLVRLKDIAEDLQEEIEQIPGILDVEIVGGLEREVQVDVNPSRLQYYNVGVNDVLDAIRQENITIPGGSMESANLKWTVRVPGEFNTIDELGDVVVKAKNGFPIYMRDLAQVNFGFKEQENYSRLDGRSTVTLSVLKRSGENIIIISDQVKEILEQAKADFPIGTESVILADQSKEIRSMVSDLENNIIAGLILVFAVLYFFMGARTGLIVGIAIPFSMLTSFIILSLLGYTLNMIVLFSLILALGMLVDNAVVIVENIYRHHHEGAGLLQAAKEATREVGMPVITSTITTLFAFLPMIFWPGIVGEFMSYLPITLIITLSSSLFVALVFNPVIASNYLALDTESDRRTGHRLLQRFTDRYETMLTWCLHHRKTVVTSTLAGYVAMFFLYANLNHGLEFFPDLEPTQAWIEIEAPIGTKLSTSDDIVREVEGRLVGTTDMKNYVADVGKSSSVFDFGTGSGSSHKSKVTIDFLERHLRDQNSFETLDQIRAAVKRIPGAKIDVSKPQDGPPTGAAVEIQIKGEDFTVLSAISGQVLNKIRDVDGITKLQDNYEKGRPEMTIRLDREKAALLGLNTMKIANTIRTAVNGTHVTDFRLGQKEHEITVRFDENFRKNYNDLLYLSIFEEGQYYPMANFARVEFSTGLSSVNHVDGDRVVTVTAEAIGRSSAEVLNEVKERLAGFETPEGYTLSFGGQDVEQQKAASFLSRAFLIAIMLIFFVLVTQFNSITLPFVIMMSVLLSFFGVFFGLLVTFKPFGIIMTGIGIISLAGVVVNNAIVLIDYIQQLRARGTAKIEAIVTGGRVRLRPVILTAITTILGLIPLTTGINIDFIGMFKGDFSKFVQIGAESSQWWSGMGVAVIFGLFFATALTLFFVPVMYFSLSDLLSDLAAKFKKKSPAPAQ